VDMFMWVLTGALVTFGVIYVHEMGHYLYGQLFAGIPGDRIRMVLRASPPHVQLESEGRFLSPDDPGYIDTFRSHAPGAGQAVGFIAAGYVLQIAATIGVVSAMTSLGVDGDLTQRVVRIAAIVTGAVLLLEAAGSLWTKAPTGDIGALWKVSRPAALALAALVVGTYLVLLVVGQ
jgi:hypothetical protein